MTVLNIELHPILVHFPIGLITIAVGFYISSLFVRQPFLKEVGFWNLIIGTIGAAASVLTGMWAEEELSPSHEIHELIEQHEILGFLTAGVFVLLSAWAFVRKDQFGKFEYLLFVSILFVGLIVLAITGYYGGELVYEYGVGTK